MKLKNYLGLASSSKAKSTTNLSVCDIFGNSLRHYVTNGDLQMAGLFTICQTVHLYLRLEVGMSEWLRVATGLTL